MAYDQAAYNQAVYDQTAAVVIGVTRAGNGRWEVREHDFPQALASFATEQAAMDYARDIAKTKSGSVISLRR